MTKIKKSDAFDTEFRAVVLAHIRNAKKSIKVRTGEIASYDFLDLRSGAEEAADRGIKPLVYATQPDKNIVNRLLYNGARVFIGNDDSEDHFMIVDDKIVIRSIKERNRRVPTPMGYHKFEVVDKPQIVKKYVKLFEKLIHPKNSKRQQIEGSDPLRESLKKSPPLSYT